MLIWGGFSPQFSFPNLWLPQFLYLSEGKRKKNCQERFSGHPRIHLDIHPTASENLQAAEKERNYERCPCIGRWVWLKAKARCSLGNCYRCSQDPPCSVGGPQLTPESNLVTCSLPHAPNDSTSHNSASPLCLASKRQRWSRLLQAEGEQWLDPTTHFMHICPTQC